LLKNRRVEIESFPGQYAIYLLQHHRGVEEIGKAFGIGHSKIVTIAQSVLDVLDNTNSNAKERESLEWYKSIMRKF
jgi:hypothetical protein